MRSRRLDAKSRLSQSIRRQDTAIPTPAALIIVVALMRSWRTSEFCSLPDIEDSVVSCTGFVQPFDRVCVELKARGANDFVELRK